MYICVDCGKVFDGDEISIWKESRGEFWGEPCTEKMYGCPNCKGEFVKAKECKICGDWIKEDDWDICEECIDKYKTADNCLEIGKDYKEKIILNGFLHFAFSLSEIENILLERLKQDEERLKSLVSDYCQEDMLYFTEWVGKKWNEEK